MRFILTDKAEDLLESLIFVVTSDNDFAHFSDILSNHIENQNEKILNVYFIWVIDEGFDLKRVMNQLVRERYFTEYTLNNVLAKLIVEGYIKIREGDPGDI